jgi:hypothetical protein
VGLVLTGGCDEWLAANVLAHHHGEAQTVPQWSAINIKSLNEPGRLKQHAFHAASWSKFKSRTRTWESSDGWIDQILDPTRFTIGLGFVKGRLSD